MNVLGLGIAMAALVFGYQSPDDGPGLWSGGLLLVFTIAAGWFSIRGALAKAPAAESDEKWDDRYDKLRDLTEAASSTLSGNYYSIRQSRMLSDLEDWPATWQQHALSVPLPAVDDRPLHLWATHLRGHSVGARQFLHFAQTVGSIVEISNFRRYAVRTYHRFGRLLASDVPEFRAWLIDEGVQAGAEPLVVLLAYLEIGRADNKRTNYPGDGHAGFWYLAEEWHPNTVALPRSTAAAGLPG